MNTKLIALGGLLAVVVLLVLGAAFPAPIQRNQFSTNVQGAPIIGTWFYSNANTISLATNYVGFDENGITEYRGGSAIWTLVSWASGNNTAFNWNSGFSALFTNGSGLFAVQDASAEPLRVFGKTGQGVPYFAALDGAGNEIGTFRTNAFWATTNDFYAVLTTTDNTTNTMLTITPRDNQSVRCVLDVIGYNSTSSASYGKLGTFKSVAGTVTQVASTSSIGVAEDDAAYECILDTSANTIRVRVAGNTGKTVNWTCYLKTFYAP